MTPYFADRDGVCDLVESVGPVDTSKLVLYAWDGHYRPSVLVGLPGAAAPGTPRVAVSGESEPTELGDAWVHPDGSFAIALPFGAGRSGLDVWYPVDDDGDVCGPKRSREEAYLLRVIEDGLPDWGCSATFPSQTLRCILRNGKGWTGTGPTFEEWCGANAGHPSCQPPGGQLCAVTTDCVEANSKPPFPHDDVRVVSRYEDSVVIVGTSLPRGSLLVALDSRNGALAFSVVGMDDPLELQLYETWMQWNVWVEYPLDRAPSTSETWVLTASIAAALAGVDD